jgi:hypothetical protein
MISSDPNEKLTPAAEKVLREIIDDYRSELLLAAAGYASRATGELREISVHDIVRALQERSTPFRRRKTKVADRLIMAYVMAGLLVAAAGFGLFGVQQFLTTANPQQRVSLLIGFSGLVISVAGYAAGYVLQLVRSRHDNDDEKYSLTNVVAKDPVAVWSEIEVFLRDFASSTMGETRAQEPIAFLVKRLADAKFLPQEDAERLQRLLTMRNRVAHGGYLADTQSHLHQTIRDAQEVLLKLQRQGPLSTAPSPRS